MVVFALRLDRSPSVASARVSMIACPKRAVFRKQKNYSLDVGLSHQDVRRTARILFIDDEMMPICESLSNQGYNVFRKRTIHSIAELETDHFHIIFCDIAGVGVELAGEEAGAGLIRMIKNQLKYPIVIAYSAYSYAPSSPQNIAMMKVADDVIAKDSTTAVYIDTIQHHSQTVFSAERCITLLAEFLRIEEKMLRKKIEKDGPRALAEYKGALQNLSVAANVASIMQTILAIVAAL